ncbi:hypothetical protein H6G96_27580 [Nostoc sp. FACHB-892]|uniref:hypothetical protein n=1 Tax=Nostoc sp. FACHB-892 TaxID=2692843 RepID=UPI001689AB24|nr:hypothetical protein [Nostoc sp. FACHB-892]MBD2729980.1 hypothetical protein [Nostoc sp. FACHB-892]
MDDQDWATQPSPFKGQYLPDYQPIVRWVMPKTSEGLLETYYYNKAGQMVREVFNQSGKKVGVNLIRTDMTKATG